MSSFAHNPHARILVADEDPTARAFLADNLAADGFIVTEAADYDAAVARLRGRPHRPGRGRHQRQHPQTARRDPRRPRSCGRRHCGDRAHHADRRAAPHPVPEPRRR